MDKLFEERHFPLRYPVVGVATFVVESMLYGTLLLLLPQEYYLKAYYTAGIAAFLCNFAGHKFFTFKNQKVRHPLKQLVMDGALKLLILATRGMVLALLVERLGFPPVSGIVITFLIAAFTFTASSWIFGGSRPKQTWKMVWGYTTFVWWIGKEYVRSLKIRFL